MVAVTTYTAPHPKHASPAQISPSSTLGSPCLLSSSNSKLNLGYHLNMSPISTALTKTLGIFLFIFSSPPAIESCLLIQPPEPMSCLHSLLPPLCLRYHHLSNRQGNPAPTTYSLVLSKVFDPQQPQGSQKTLRWTYHSSAQNPSCVPHFPKVSNSHHVPTSAPLTLSIPSLFTSQ